MALDGHIYALRIDCRCSLASKDIGGLIYMLMFKPINRLRVCELPASLAIPVEAVNTGIFAWR